MEKTKLVLDKDSQKILKEIGLLNLEDEEKKEVAEALIKHFERIILETALLNLNEKQAKEFKLAVENPKDLEDRIIKITAQSPGLAEKIEKSVENELALIKAMFRQSQPPKVKA